MKTLKGTLKGTAGWRGGGAFIGRRVVLAFLALLAGMGAAGPWLHAQASGSAGMTAQQHYDEAFRLQEAGRIAEADGEHKLFLAMALHKIANGRANLGEYGRAVPLYDEALDLMPDDVALRMDYAGAALDGFDWKKAQTMAAAALELMKRGGQGPTTAALSILAQAMMGTGQYHEALEQFKTIAGLEPGYKSSYALAGVYLALGDKPSAAKILSEMSAKYGDTATQHMDIGRLYGQALYYDEAIQEFKTAIAKDDGKLAGVHYSLGATYMMRFGEPSFADAEAELRKELAINAQSPLAYTALGRIETMQRRYTEAEADLRRAVELDPEGTAAYAELGQLYTETGKVAEAETAFRKQIALTLVPAKNDYEVQRAHFQLGRLLEKSGNAAEGAKELEISRDLLYEKSQQVERKLRGNATLFAPVAKTREARPEDLEAQNSLESQAGRVLASSYDSLGVHAAIGGSFALAAGYFGRAAQWDPALNRIDRKWGRAAFAAKDYAQAVEPLGQALAEEPEDGEVRRMLGMSCFMTHDYARTLKVLQPVGTELDANTPLGLAYMGAMAIAGDVRKGVAGLTAYAQSHPDGGLAHRLLGEAYAGGKTYVQAEKEFQIALKLDAGDADAKFGLAMTDAALGKRNDAQALLLDLTKAGSKDGEVYYRLGELQMELGAVKAAVSSLESAVKLKPASADYHRELAAALKKNEQPQEAEHEARKAQALLEQSGGHS